MLCIGGGHKPFLSRSPQWIADPSSQTGHRALPMDTGHSVMVQRDGAAGGEPEQAIHDGIAVEPGCGKVGSRGGRRAAGSPRPRQRHDRE
jgi:hypothetical protein